MRYLGNYDMLFPFAESLILTHNRFEKDHQVEKKALDFQTVAERIWWQDFQSYFQCHQSNVLSENILE